MDWSRQFKQMKLMDISPDTDPEDYSHLGYEEQCQARMMAKGARYQEFRKQYRDLYQRYLKSQEWLDKRMSAFRRDGGICQGCMSNTAIEVHHRTYDNIGNEFIFELISLCESCHRRIHPNKSDM